MGRRSVIGIESTAQQFGGPWTLLKTDIVASYLQFFVKALKNQPFDLVYIDAFAGSGAFTFIGEESAQEVLFASALAKSHSGSARRALELVPSFDEVIFIEEKATNVRSLRQLIEASGHKNASVRHGDANKELLDLCDPRLWLNRRSMSALSVDDQATSPRTEMLVAAKFYSGGLSPC
jgi:three-Cys-motif partner protein